MTKIINKWGWWSALLGLVLGIAALPTGASGQYIGQDQDQQGQYQDQRNDQGNDQPQDQQDDPPSRVARLGYMNGSISFQPAGESDWVQAVANRPMTTGDKLWADENSRAELQLGSAVIRLDSNTGFSFLNLDDTTVQIQLTSGAINLRVRRLDANDVYEIDTPNLAFTVDQPGSYRVEASEDGTYSVISIREGSGEATGNGQTYTLHAGQRGTFDGTDSLNAEVTDIGGRDQFDNWYYERDRRYDHSPSSQYVSQDVVGYQDLDDYGDWRNDSDYGHVWFPNQVAVDWAPYHTGHWDWIAPWGYTWVDDSPWGYAPFHYGRWVTVGGRWGWVAGPIAVRAVYAPALVVFIGGGPGGFGGNVGWFPLGPREVYVPSYRVSRAYVNRVNISNTTVNTVQITNVYNTTIINRTTNITNITYANRNVRGAVIAVPQRSFASAQPVGRVAVAMNAQQIASAPVSARVAVVPTRESVLGAKFATADRVKAPPAAVMSRQVVAKRTPPPPPVPFVKQQQALEAHPGQALSRSDVRNLRPASAETLRPMVKQAPPGKPATANLGRPGSQPNPGRPAQPGMTPPGSTSPNQPENRQPGMRPENQLSPNQRPGAMNPPPNRPDNNRPGNVRPENVRPENVRPEPNPAPQRPNNTRPNPPEPAPDMGRPVPPPKERPDANRPDANRPANDRNSGTQPGNRPDRPDRPQPRPAPAEAKPVPPREPARPQTSEEKKQQQKRDDEQRKRDQQKPPGE
jgi:hypothetical protein